MNTHLHNYTQTQQSRLAGYCRTGKLNSIDGLTENRVHHYRGLVYNVVDDTLQSAFPLTFDLLLEDEWNEIVHYFFSTHKCQSNSVWKMPHEFYQFIESCKSELKNKYPLLTELLLFEWLEVELYMMEDKIIPTTKSEGDPVNDIIEFNPEFKLLRLSYPVHLKNPNQIISEDKGEYFVLIFRERESGMIQFINLSMFFTWTIEKINIEALPLKNVLEEAEKIFKIDYQTLLKNTLPFFEELKNKQFILGYKDERKWNY